MKIEDINNIGPYSLKEPITEKELQVCELVYKGMSNKQIGNELNITEFTTKLYITKILKKLKLKNRLKLIIFMSERNNLK